MLDNGHPRAVVDKNGQSIPKYFMGPAYKMVDDLKAPGGVKFVIKEDANNHTDSACGDCVDDIDPVAASIGADAFTPASEVYKEDVIFVGERRGDQDCLIKQIDMAIDLKNVLEEMNGLLSMTPQHRYTMQLRSSIAELQFKASRLLSKIGNNHNPTDENVNLNGRTLNHIQGEWVNLLQIAHRLSNPYVDGEESTNDDEDVDNDEREKKRRRTIVNC